MATSSRTPNLGSPCSLPEFAATTDACRVQEASGARLLSRRDGLRSLLPLVAAPLWLAGSTLQGADAAGSAAEMRAVPPGPTPAGASDRSPSIDLHLGGDRGFAKWWIPEHIMLGHTDRSLGIATPVDWKSLGDNGWRYESPIADRGHAVVKVKTVDHGFEGTITLENRSRDVWTNVVAAVCLLLPDSPFFADPEWERTYYRSGGQFRAYREQERDSGDGTFQMSLVNGRAPLVRSQRHMRKWGFTAVPSEDGIIAVRSRDGSATLVTTWERVHHLQANRQPTYRCIHPNPFFGTIRPGETKTTVGCVLLASGPPDAAWQAAKQWLASRR